MESKLVCPKSELNDFFYQKLFKINQVVQNPVPERLLYYSSNLLVYYSFTTNLQNEKNLGQTLYQAGTYPFEKQAQVYKDVGDTSLFLCGYFAPSLNKKILDHTYYEQMGVSAYNRLISLGLESVELFKLLSNYFAHLVNILSVVASKDKSDPMKQYLCTG